MKTSKDMRNTSWHRIKKKNNNNGIFNENRSHSLHGKNSLLYTFVCSTSDKERGSRKNAEGEEFLNENFMFSSNVICDNVICITNRRFGFFKIQLKKAIYMRQRLRSLNCQSNIVYNSLEISATRQCTLLH